MKQFDFHKFIIIVSAVLFAAACSSDKGSSEDKEPALSAPTLTAPANAAAEVGITPVFTWQAPSIGNNPSYEISLSTDDGLSWTSLGNELTATNYAVPELRMLKRQTTYKWKVAARMAAAAKESSVYSFTTANLPAPQLQSPGSNASSVALTPTLSWNFQAADNVTYSVSISADQGTSWQTAASGLSATSYNLTTAQKLERNKTYRWKVGVSGNGGSNESTVRSFSTANLTPPVLTSPAAGVTGVSILPILSWQASQGTNITYEVKISDNSGLSWTSLASALQVTSYTVTDAQKLSRNKTYQWKVVVSDAYGSEESPASSFTTANMNTPTLKIPTNNAVEVNLTPTFSWTNVAGTNVKYELKISSNSGVSWTSMASDLSGILYTLTDAQKLTRGTVYQWKVIATDDSGGNAESNPYSFTTAVLTAPVLSAPATVATGISILPVFTWVASTGTNVKYEVKLSSDNGMSWTTLASDLTAVSYTAASAQRLQRNVSYTWKVVASDAYGQVESQQRSFTTADLPAVRLSSPANGATAVAANPTLSWDFTAPSDSPSVSFAVKVSTNGTSWTTKATGLTAKNYTFADAASVTKYWWQVVATDAYGGESTSATYTFTLATVYHADGSASLWQNNTLGTNPCTFIIVGDGFIREDYAVGGTFDTWVDTIMEGIFSIEPYKSYRQYFRVYKVNTYSVERGASVAGYRPESPSAGRPSLNAQTKNTFFGCTLRANTETLIDANMTVTDIRSYIRGRVQAAFPAFTTAQFNESTILMQVNINSWAGSCSIGVGSSSSIAKTALDANAMKRNVHEGAGHGWGKLLDEYINEPAVSANAGRGSNLRSYRSYGYGDNVSTPWCFGGNLDLTGSTSSVHWKHYFSLAGYEDVMLYEGGYTVGKDVWQPTYSGVTDTTESAKQWAAEGYTPYKNIMHGSAYNLWFNAPSREAIVRRIMKVSGGTFNFDTFLAKDRAVNGNVRPSGSRNYIEIDMPHDPPEAIDIHGNVLK